VEDRPFPPSAQLEGTRHGSNVELRVTLEPLLVQYGVNVVFSGHARIYESDETMRARVP
jgi:hypothetical protein